MLGNWPKTGKSTIRLILSSIAIGISIPFLASSVAAELTWESIAISQSAIAGDTSASTEFRFRNSGGHPVVIRSVRPTCDCTTFDLNKMLYESGDGGTIKLRMDIGSSKRGTVDRTIEVLYEDTAPVRQILRWIVHIPEPVIIKPDTLCWSGTRDTRIIGIARTGSEPINVSKIETSNNHLVWNIVTVSESDAYEIHVVPRSGSKNVDTQIRILAGAAGREKWYEIRAYVLDRPLN